MRNCGHVFFLPLLVLVLAGCGKSGVEPVEPDGRGGAIEFRIGFADDGATRVVTDADFRCDWEEGDAFGLFVVREGVPMAASGNYKDNVKFSYGSDKKWTIEEEGEKLLWPEDEGGLSFFAYYPYDPEFDPTAGDFAVAADQSEGYEENYRMRATGNGNGEVVTLDFGHLFALVQLTIDASMIPTDRTDPPVVKLRGVTLGDPALGDAATDITMHRTETEPGVYVCRALVPPQTIDAGTVMFTFPVHYTQPEDKVRNFGSEALGETLTLEAGAAEAFTLTFKLENYSSLIPDPKVVSLVEREYGNGDGALSYEEMMAVDWIDGYDSNITSLEGIEFFKNLETLWCDENMLTELDVSALPKLDMLACNHNPLTELDLSCNSVIRIVYCGNGNPLEELTVMVDPSRTLGDNPGDLKILVSNNTNPMKNDPVLVTQKGVPMFGVTVIDKTM